MTTCTNRNALKTGVFNPQTAPTKGACMRLQRDGKQNSDNEEGHDTGLATRTRSKVKRPSLYRVLLLNDDYTPMEFVVAILQDVFNRNQDDAVRIMMHVHNYGVGECGVYPYEVAETKVTRVMNAAHKNQHPLQCVMEKQ
jgi:ATP-dependent Clp protease adaptor protein ClpS